MDGECDHVHLLINYPPKLAISNLVNRLKGVFSRQRRRDRPDIAQRYYYKGVLWTPGYFASSCDGTPVAIIRQYIGNSKHQVSRKTTHYIPALKDGILRRT